MSFSCWSTFYEHQHNITISMASFGNSHLIDGKRIHMQVEAPEPWKILHHHLSDNQGYIKVEIGTYYLTYHTLLWLVLNKNSWLRHFLRRHGITVWSPHIKNVIKNRALLKWFLGSFMEWCACCAVQPTFKYMYCRHKMMRWNQYTVHSYPGLLILLHVWPCGGKPTQLTYPFKI